MTKRRKHSKTKGLKRPDFWWDKYHLEMPTPREDRLSWCRNIILGNTVNLLKNGMLQEMEAQFVDTTETSYDKVTGNQIMTDEFFKDLSEEEITNPRSMSMFGKISSILYAQWCACNGKDINFLEQQYQYGDPAGGLSGEEVAHHISTVFENYAILAKWLYHEQPSAIVTDLMAKAFADMDTNNVPTELFQMPFDAFYIHLETPMVIDWKPSEPNVKAHPNDNKIVGFLVADGRKDPIQGPLAASWDYSHRPRIKVIALRESYTGDSGYYLDGLVNADEWGWYLDGETVGEGHPLKSTLKEQRAVNPKIMDSSPYASKRTMLYMEQAQNLVINALLYLNATNRKVREEKIWGDTHKRFEFLWKAQLLLHKAKTRKDYRRAKELLHQRKRNIKKSKAGHVFWIDEHKDESPDTNGNGQPHTSPTTHWRRAHWHSFRYGAMKQADGTPIPKEKRPLRLKFLPPVRIKGRKKKEDTARTSYGMRMFTPEER